MMGVRGHARGWGCGADAHGVGSHRARWRWRPDVDDVPASGYTSQDIPMGLTYNLPSMRWSGRVWGGSVDEWVGTHATGPLETI
jgi:hypothetical protein